MKNGTKLGLSYKMFIKEINRFSLLSFVGFTAITITSLMVAWQTDLYFLMAIPAVILVAMLAILNTRNIFYLLLFAIPCSIEFSFSASLATDIPTEPLIVGLMICFFVFMAYRPHYFDVQFFKHPFILLLGIQFCWMIFASIYSIDPQMSLKYLLAKIWYLCAFIGMGSVFLREEKDIKSFFWYIYIPLTILIVVSIIRFIPLGFAFDSVNKTMTPYFRNKVIYGTFMSIFLPFIFTATHWYEKGSFKRMLLQVSKLFYVIAIYFTYTRACILSLLACILFYFVIKYRKVKQTLVMIFIFVAMIIGYLVHDNKFMDYSPSFLKTIYHDNYEDHLTSTVSFEDASSMERIFMWIGGAYYFLESPIVGNGPNTFFPNYKHYTVNSFKTYLSENDEHLTIHNYFLLTLIEQGLVGIFIFLLIIVVLLLYAEKYYHLAKPSFNKNLLMATTLSFVCILVNCTLSDLLETDKIGSIYFLNIAILVNIMVVLSKANTHGTNIIRK